MLLVDSIKEALKGIWNFIKRVYTKIVNFVSNIKAWFLQPKYIERIRDDKAVIAVSIKVLLDNESYNIVNCLYDKDTESIVGDEALIIEAEKLDEETSNKFGNKDMIILQ